MYFPISLLSRLSKGQGPLFEQTWTPSTQGCFVPSSAEIGPVQGSGEEDANVQCLQTDGKKDGRWTTGDQKSSAQVS